MKIFKILRWENEEDSKRWKDFLYLGIGRINIRVIVILKVMGWFKVIIYWYFNDIVYKI